MLTHLRRAVPKAAIAAVAVLPAVSFAALPDGVDDMFTNLATDFGLYLGLGFTLLLVVTSGMIGLGWAPKIAKKVTK